MVQIGATFGAETAFIEPEILKVDPAKIDTFIAQEPRLKVYTFYLHDILRRRAHTLTDAEERLLASSSVMASAPSTTYGILSDADFPYPSVTLADGKSVKLDSAGVHAVPRRAQPRRSREGDVGVLRRARRLPRHVRIDAERPGPVRRVLRQGAATTRARSRRALDAREHPDHGLHAAHRRRESQPADLPSLPEAAQDDDEAAGAALLRSLCAARRVGRSDLHRRRSARST